MEFPTSTIEISRKVEGDTLPLTYSYIHIEPSNRSKPYVLFLHGFPSLPVDFYSQISHLSSLGYGIVAPELLGYGDTSHPTESDAYRLKLMAGDLVEILDHLGIPKVFAVGHDWGSSLLSRLEFYHSDRISKMVLLAVGPAPIGQSFDVHAVNATMKQHMGYEGFGYMVFFTSDPAAADILNAHQESFRSLVYHADPELWKQHLCAIGGLKQWLKADRKTDGALSSFTDKTRKAHEVAFSNSKGGYTGTLNWYKNHILNKNTPDEQAELGKRGLGSYQTETPFLQILAEADPVALAPIHKQMAMAYTPHAETKVVNAGHWVMMETADEVTKLVVAFFASDRD